MKPNWDEEMPWLDYDPYSVELPYDSTDSEDEDDEDEAMLWNLMQPFVITGLINMASSGVKDFYRQKKKGGVTKAPPSSKKKTQQYTGGASLGASDTAQTSALVSHGSWDLKDDFGDQEEQLRQFDMDMKFGPSIGVTRLQRWERASAMGLQPPPHIQDLLLRTSSTKTRGSSDPSLECLWEGKV